MITHLKNFMVLYLAKKKKILNTKNSFLAKINIKVLIDCGMIQCNNGNDGKVKSFLYLGNVIT